MGDALEENAVWSYETPMDPVAGMKDYLALYFNKMEAWYEEDEQIEKHPRSPEVRVDVLRSSRRVQVLLGGETLADSTQGRMLFETGHRTRFYLPREDVRMELLSPSETQSVCPYKGTATYWHVTVDGKRHPDLVWAYPTPHPESLRIKDLLCFYEERMDVLVDGEPATPLE